MYKKYTSTQLNAAYERECALKIENARIICDLLCIIPIDIYINTYDTVTVVTDCGNVEIIGESFVIAGDNFVANRTENWIRFGDDYKLYFR